MPRQIQVPYEQAVYGSFPFWDRGYAILTHSPGCQPEWLTSLRAVCQRYGEPTVGVGDVPALFTLELDEGPRLIVGVGPQGRDDRGRPGALAFHALFIHPDDYRLGGGNPFDYLAALRSEWQADTEPLASGLWSIGPIEPAPAPACSQAESIASALIHGRRVAIQTPEPIDALASQVWSVLPSSVRCRASVATWAYANGNRFDLVALPRLTGIELDPSYVSPTEATSTSEFLSTEPAELSAQGFTVRLRPAWRVLGVATLVLGAGLGWAFRPESSKAVPASREDTSHSFSIDRAAPDVSAYRDQLATPEEKARVTEALIDLAERFGTIDAGDPAREDPTELMTLLASRLRYRGPWLSAAELEKLDHGTRSKGETQGKSDPGSLHDRAQALAWHEHTRRFAADRPLPSGFRDGPLRWQLETLGWSFHLDAPPLHRRSPAEIPHALADALAVDVSLVPNPLADQLPALTAYRAFLNRLPRR